MQKAEKFSANGRVIFGFYCDKCGRKIGESSFDADKYMPRPSGCHELNDLIVENSSVRQLCDSCFSLLINESSDDELLSFGKFLKEV